MQNKITVKLIEINWVRFGITVGYFVQIGDAIYIMGPTSKAIARLKNPAFSPKILVEIG
jgi:hypothetical protein